MQDSGVMRGPVAALVTVLLGIALLPLWSGGGEPLGHVIGVNVLLLAAVLIWLQPKQRVIGWHSPLALSALALLAWAVLSLVWSVDRYASELWVAGIVAGYAAFAVAYRLSGPERGRWVERAYLVVAGLSSLYGLWIYFTSSYDRLTSSFYWPNPMAAFLLPAAILGLDQVARRDRRWPLWALALINLVAFWLTQSRGATLVLVLAVVILIWKERRSRSYIAGIIVSLVASFLVSTIGVQLWHLQHEGSLTTTVTGRFVNASANDATSTSVRLDFWRSALAIWESHPFEGSGAGTFAVEHPRYQQRVIAASSDAHNWYLQTLSELGTMGGVLLAALAISLWRGVRRGLREQPTLFVWALCIGAVLLHFALDIDGQFPVLMVLVGAGLGLIWRPAIERPQARTSIALPVLLVAALTVVSSANQSQIISAQADAAQATGDLAGSANLYLQAHQTLAYDPELIEAEGIDYYSLALEGKNRSANLALALDRAKTAERAAPTEAQNYQLEGRVLLAMGKDEQAEQALSTALRLDPYNQPSYAQDLAVSLQDQGRTLEALAVTHAMLERYPEAVLRNRSSSVDTITAVYQLWLYQQFLDHAAGNRSAEVNDARMAHEVAKLVPAS